MLETNIPKLKKTQEDNYIFAAKMKLSFSKTKLSQSKNRGSIYLFLYYYSSIYMRFYLSIYLPIYLSTYQATYLPTYLCIYLSIIHMYINPSYWQTCCRSISTHIQPHYPCLWLPIHSQHWHQTRFHAMEGTQLAADDPYACSVVNFVNGFLVMNRWKLMGQSNPHHLGNPN